MEWTREDGYLISTDKQRLDIDYIYQWLSEQSYWARGRSRATVEQSIANSLCFGLYHGSKQVGFARVVTDLATFGWLCDVYVDESYRGHALGKWLIQTVVNHPDLAQIRRLMLATRDAHELYRKYGGFEMLGSPERWMAKTQSV